MIPKVIHYCWFGEKQLPETARRCIASWRKYCPNYEIREWNESNYNVNKIRYIKEAYAAKKYAFVSDYARYDILYHFGGVYFDTDVEVIRQLDDVLDKGSFMGCEENGNILADGVKTIGIDTDIYAKVNPGLGIAAIPGLEIYKEILDTYANLVFINDDGSFNLKTVVEYTTNIFIKHGLKNVNTMQSIAGINIYPKEYFCPLNYHTQELELTEKTVSIHHYSATWLTYTQRKISDIEYQYLKRPKLGKIIMIPWIIRDRLEQGGIKVLIKSILYKIIRK